MHSAPVLMLPSTGTAPLVLWDRLKGKSGKYTEADIDIMLVSASLDYRPYVDYNNSSDYKALLEKWGDIVKSVDIFISKPIYMWNPDGKIDSFYDSDNFDTKFIGRLFCKGTSTILIPSVKEDYAISRFEIGDRGHTSNTKEAFDNLYLEWSYKQIYALFKNPERTYPATTIHLPEHTEEKIRETIENTSTFYKLHSIPISDLPPADSSIMNIEGERKEISVADDYLQSLVSREVMTDDYLSHDNLAADYSVNFNSRLNLSGVKRKLFNGFPPSSMFCYRNRMTSEYNSGASDSATFKFTLITDTFSLNDTFVEIFIKENGNNYRVMSSSVTTPFLSSVNILAQSKIKTSWGTYLFYPNVNAFKLVIRDAIGEYVIDLKPHDFLNGAYALLDFETVRDNMDYPEININQYDDNWIDVHNKIYTSEINNPFLFPLLGINTVGTGKILAIATAAKALSQGQFGQFPLYAFTTEGVWALEINSSGNFTARQPITRDVCTNIDAITQLDSEVLFITDRGIILISGSNTTCISDIINTEFPFDISTLPGISQLHRLTAPDLYPDNYLDIIPFSEFVKGCGMLYDYVHQRVIVYNPDTSYAYVFSLNSKSWGMMNLNIQSGINSYPDALAIDKDNNLVSFSIHSQVKRKGLYITRPFKLGDGNTLKTIDSVIQRGSFAKGNVTTVLYGSRDLINWHLVWTSKDHFLRGFRGTPYKYFRIAGITDLNFMESLSGASIQFTPRLTNQPR